MISSVLFPIRWVAPPPNILWIVVSSVDHLQISLSSTTFIYSFVLHDLSLHLGECDRTLLSVLTFPICLSEVCVHLKPIFSSKLKPFNRSSELFIISVSLKLKTIAEAFPRNGCDLIADRAYPLNIL